MLGHAALAETPLAALPAATGGTTYTQSAAGSTAATGALVRAVAKALAGSSTASGVARKSLAKPLAGSATASAALAKLCAKPLAGSCTTSGVVTRQAAKAMAGSCAATAGLTRQGNKALTGSSTPAGGATRSTAKGLAASATPAGTLAKQVAKPLAGSSTPTGSLSTLKAALLSLGGALTAAGALAKRALKALAGYVTGTGALATEGGSEPAGVSPGGSVSRDRSTWARKKKRATWLRTAARSLPSLARTWRYREMSLATESGPALVAAVSDDRDYAFDLRECPEVVGGATITSVEMAGGSGLTMGTPAVLASAFDGIPAGQGVSVRISGGAAGTTYRMAAKVTLSTGRVVVVPARLEKVADYGG